MFNRGSRAHRRNAKIITPPPYNRGPWELRRNAISALPLPYNRGPWERRRNATRAAPPLYFGATTGAQKCQPVAAPMGRVNHQLQQCQPVSTLPHLTTGSHPNDAAMLFINRSRFIWCRSTRAEMPLYWRTNNQRPLQKRRNVRYASPRIKQGDPLWINVTKTQPLPRYI